MDLNFIVWFTIIIFVLYITLFFVPAEKKIFDGDYGIGPFRPSVRASVRASVRPSESFLDSNQTYFFEFLIVYRCSRTRYFRHSTNFDPFYASETCVFHSFRVKVGNWPLRKWKKVGIFFSTIHLFHIIISMTTTYWMIILNVCLYFEIIKKLHKFLFWLFITFLTLKDGYTMLRRTYFIQFSTFYSS